jgi:hypothetical protein
MATAAAPSADGHGLVSPSLKREPGVHIRGNIPVRYNDVDWKWAEMITGGVQGGRTRTTAESLSERGGMDRVMGGKGDERR